MLALLGAAVDVTGYSPVGNTNPVLLRIAASSFGKSRRRPEQFFTAPNPPYSRLVTSE